MQALASLFACGQPRDRGFSGVAAHNRRLCRITLPKQQKTRQNLSGFCGELGIRLIAERASLLAKAKRQPRDRGFSGVAACNHRLHENPSSEATKNPTKFVGFLWRRKRDSNPRGLSPKRFSRPPRYDRFDIPPCCMPGISVESIAIIAYFVNRIIEIVVLKSVVVFRDVARDAFYHFAGDSKPRDRRHERKRARRRAAARIHVVRVRRGFLFHRFFG